MDIGDVEPVTTGDVSDTYYLDTGMYDTAGYGAVYVVDAQRPALVETGIGTNHEYVLDALDELEIAPEDIEIIALTHVHLDHAGGAGFLAEACPNATVYVHEIGAPHVIDPTRLWEGTKRAVGGQIEYYTEPEPVPEERVREMAGGDEIDLGDRTLRAVYAPGHAPHQIAFHDPEAAAVFTGDAAGIYVPEWDEVQPTTPPPNFDLERAVDDAHALSDLDPEVLLYTHFGPAPAGEKLEWYTDTLEGWVADIEAARNELDDEDAVIDRFVAEAETDAVWGEEKSRYETALNVRGVLDYLDTRE